MNVNGICLLLSSTRPQGVSLWSRAAHPLLVYHDLLIATVKDSHHTACWLRSKLPGRTEEGMNRWDAVTDGDWGSEAGQQCCASLSPTDIIYRFKETHKCWCMKRNGIKDRAQKVYFVLHWFFFFEETVYFKKIKTATATNGFDEIFAVTQKCPVSSSVPPVTRTKWLQTPLCKKPRFVKLGL